MRPLLRTTAVSILLASVWMGIPAETVAFVDQNHGGGAAAGLNELAAPPVIVEKGEAVTGPASELISDDLHVSAMATMELARTAGPEQVDALLDQYWMMNDEGARLRILYIFARTQGRFNHSARDILLRDKGFALLNRAAHGDLDSDTGVAILALGALGNPRSAEVLSSIGADLEDPAAGDALFAMARFPSEAGMDALEGLAVDGSNDAVSLKALEALVAAVHLAPDTDPLINEARNFLSTDGVDISHEIEEQSEIAGLRHFARSLNQQLLSI